MTTSLQSSNYQLLNASAAELSRALSMHLMENRSSLPLVFWVDLLKLTPLTLKTELCDRTAQYALGLGTKNLLAQYITAIRDAWHDVFADAYFAAEQAKTGALRQGAHWTHALFDGASDRDIAKCADTIKLGRDSLCFLDDEEWRILLSAIGEPSVAVSGNK